MKDQETLNLELYNILKTRGYKPEPKNEKNERTSPNEASVFHFTFIKDDKEYGEAWVTLDDEKAVLYYSNEQMDSPSDANKKLPYNDTWFGFKKHLKDWAMSKQRGIELKNKDEIGDDMALREYRKKKATMSEAYHPMGKKASYSDNFPAVKIIIQHNRPLEEHESRFRNVAKIFLENTNGERFLAPTTRPGIAQIYARHIAEGGVPNDERWNHIKSLCEEYSKMAGFVRATRSKQFNESAQSLVSEGINHYQSLRETLGKLRGHRGYNQYFESWTPTLMEDDTDGTEINELFVQETVDPRIESVMPILSRLYKKTGETPVKEVKELEQWADSIVEGEETLEEDSDSSPVEAAILRRIAHGRTDLSKHGNDKVMDAVKEVADYVGDVEEIGSSDVSAYIKHVEQILGHREVDEDLSSMMRKGAKKVQRAFSFWDGSAHLEDLKDYVKNASDETLIRLSKDAKDDPKLHSPRAVQIKLIDRELKRRYGLTPKANIKPEETLEGLDKDQKKAGQLGPTERVGPKGAVGKLVGEGQEDLETIKRLMK
jgi:hypothetical protein